MVAEYQNPLNPRIGRAAARRFGTCRERTMYPIAHLTASELPFWMIALVLGVTLGMALSLALLRRTER